MKTICPCGWSDEEGDGTEVPAEEGTEVEATPGVTVEKLKSGVEMDCVA